MKLKYILLILILLIVGAAGAYWYYFVYGTVTPADTVPVTQPGGFVPFDRNTPSNIPPASTSATLEPSTTATDTDHVEKPPRLRLLSNTPVGGYGASTTLPNKTLATPGVTLVRWVDRGRGNIYQAQSDTVTIETLSNTVVPRIVDSAWNTHTTSFVAAMLLPDNSGIDLIYTTLRPQTGTSTAAYSLRGAGVHTDVITYAVSPKKDRLFALVQEEGSGVGYISGLDGQKMVKIFTTPLTQVTAEWPEENTIAITTKASANQDGFLYFVSPTTGTWKRIAGPLHGLTTTVSHDAKYVLLSSSKGAAESIKTTILNVIKNTQTETTFRTISSKCSWGNFYKELVYCAVPSQLPNGVYPNDWDLGTMSFNDKMWQIKAETGELKLISSLVDQSDRPIDAYRMSLDRNDNYLFFINKNDLSLWSLDLVAQ
jgi:hypothetical protein